MSYNINIAVTIPTSARHLGNAPVGETDFPGEIEGIALLDAFSSPTIEFSCLRAVQVRTTSRNEQAFQ